MGCEIQEKIGHSNSILCMTSCIPFIVLDLTMLSLGPMILSPLGVIQQWRSSSALYSHVQPGTGIRIGRPLVACDMWRLYSGCLVQRGVTFDRQ